MYCRHCGKDMGDPEKFCLFCGKVTGFVPDEPPSPAPVEGGQTAALPEEIQAAPLAQETQMASVAKEVATSPFAEGASASFPAEKAVASSVQADDPEAKKTRKVVAIALAIAAAILLFMVLHVLVFSDSAEAAEVSVITRIMPKDESGEYLTDYTAQIEGQDGSRYSCDVHNANGFNFGDFGVDLPLGIYQLLIINNNGNIYGPYEVTYVIQGDPDLEDDWEPTPIPYEDDENDDDGDEDDSDEENAADTKELQKAAYAAYYEKCQEYMALTDGTVGEERNYANSEQDAKWCVGLNLVDLVDFDQDGVDELVLAYYDHISYPVNDAMSQSMLEAYSVEIWQYRDGEIECIYEGAPVSSNGGIMWLQYFKWGSEGDSELGFYSQEYIEQSNSDYAIVRSFWKHDGETFVEAERFECPAYATVNPVYLIDGSEVPEEKFNSSFAKASEKLENDGQILYLNTYGTDTEDFNSGYKAVEFAEARELTMKNVEALRKAGGGFSAKKSSQVNIEDFSQRLEQLRSSYESEFAALPGDTQSYRDCNLSYSEEFDALLIDVLAALDSQGSNAGSDQASWESERAAAVEEARAVYEGGTLASVVGGQAYIEETASRIEYLISCLKETGSADEPNAAAFDLGEYAGNYYDAVEGDWNMSIQIEGAGQDSYIVLYDDPERTPDADFFFELQEGVTTYTLNPVNDEYLTCRFDFEFGDGWIEMTIEDVSDNPTGSVPEGTFVLYERV